MTPCRQAAPASQCLFASGGTRKRQDPSLRRKKRDTKSMYFFGPLRVMSLHHSRQCCCWMQWSLGPQ